MRKIIGVMLCFSFLLLFTACGDNEDDSTTLPQIDNDYSESTTIAENVNVTYVLTTDPNKALPDVETTQVVITEAETDESSSSSSDGSVDVDFTSSYVTAPEVITSVIPTVATATTTRSTITSPTNSDGTSSDESTEATTTTALDLSGLLDSFLSSEADKADDLVGDLIGTTTTTSATTTTSSSSTSTTQSSTAQEVDLVFSSVYYDGSQYLILVIDTSNWESNLVFAANSTQIQIFDSDVSQGFVDCIISEGGSVIKVDVSSITSQEPMISFSIPAGFLSTTSGTQKSAIYIMGEERYGK